MNVRAYSDFQEVDLDIRISNSRCIFVLECPQFKIGLRKNIYTVYNY